MFIGELESSDLSQGVRIIVSSVVGNLVAASRRKGKPR